MLLASIVGLLIIAIIVWTITTYNKFITLGERVANGKAQIATQIESRWDAIQSLITATKKYSQHEGEVLEGITEKRTRIGRNSSIEEMEENDTQLNQVVGKLIAISENYPDLKASEVYQSTMESINKFEDNVRSSRMIYNDVVTRYNRQLRIFPSNIVAKLFNFTVKEYFEGTETKQEMPSWD